MVEPVYVIGAGRTDFKRNFKKEGLTLRQAILEAGRAAVANAGIDPASIEAGVVGNFAGGLFTRQLHLGAYLTEIDDSLRGLPTLHVEAACASGGMAVLTAAQQIMGGLHEVMIVVGAEQQKTMSPADGADVLGAAADYQVEKPEYGEFMFPKLFAQIAESYRKRYGLTEKQLSLVGAKNYAHAHLNPLAQMREATYPPAENPLIAPPLRLSECSPITDGSAAVILCSQRFMKQLNPRHRMKLLGYGNTTDYLPLAKKDAPEFPITRRAVEKAFAMAGVALPEIQGIEIHDCFAISEIIAYELLGLAERGQGAQLLERNAVSFVNRGGGLMGDGHPVGATGVRQVVEAWQHLTETAGARQIAGAKRYLTFNIGGTYTTNVVMIWEREN